MKELARFIFEVGLLEKLPRTGYFLANVDNPEKIAEHSHRAAIIAYALAKLEGCDPCKAAMMCLLHDIGEVRIGDINKVAARYIKYREAEKIAFREQIAKLPKDIRKDFDDIVSEFEERKTKEAIVAKDADELDCAFRSKEYLEKGHKGMQNWINNARKFLKTESAKKIMAEMEKMNSWDWWKGLKKLER